MTWKQNEICKFKMADALVEASLNESALKRFDPYVKEIIDTAKYVALYSFNDNVWTKTKVEGSLFVYARTGEPLYNILVLNRLENKNLVEPINPQLDIQVNEPYLLYRNSEGNIFGIWFFDVEDCTRLSKLIIKLMERPTNQVKSQAVTRSNGQNIDIFKMLTQAQEKAGRPIPQTNSSPKELDGTPKSVADFFAKAGSAPVETTVIQRPKPVNESEKGSGFLQQLMFNPVHSVEHIEKQQLVTPHSAEIGVDSLKQLLQPHSCEKPKQSNGFSLMSLSHIDDDPIYDGFSQLNLNGTPVEEKKPDLMPPAMFTKEAVTPRRESSRAPEPLTRNQLLQAFDYLLKNDAEFMTKLHEAYVKSLTDKIY